MTIAANARNVFIIRGVLRRPSGRTPRSSSRSPSPRAAPAPTARSSAGTSRDLRRRLRQRTGDHRPRGGARRSLRHQGRRRRREGADRDPLDVRRRHDLDRDRRQPHDGRQEPAGEHRAEPVRPGVGRPRDRAVGEIKGKEGLSNKEEALFLIQGLNAHGIQPGLDRAQQRHHPRHRGQRRGDPGRPDRRDPRGGRALQGLGRAARHLRQQLSERLRAHRGRDAHDEGERRHRAADDLLGRQGQRLRQRRAGREAASSSRSRARA